MSVTYAVNQTALNRLEVSLGALPVTPAPGTSVDAAGNFGQLVIGTTGMGTVLVTMTLQNPSFSYAGRTATLLGVPLSATASNSGTAAAATINDKNGVVIIPTLTVGTSGTDIIIGSTTVTSGQTVTCTSGTLTG